MKKLLSLLLVSGLALSLTACKEDLPADTNDEGNTAEEGLVPEEGATLKLWIDNEDWANALIEKFNAKYPDVTVEFEQVGSVDARTKIELDGPAGLGADVYVAPHDHFGAAMASGILGDLPAEVNEWAQANLADVALKTVTQDGKLYGVPVSVEAQIIFYNKDIVGDAPIRTWEDMQAFASEFNNPAENKFAFMWEPANAYFGYGFLTPYGYNLFGADGRDGSKPGFDSPEFIKGLEFLKSLRPMLDVNSADLTEDFIVTSFIEGRAAYILNGPWKIKDLQTAGVNFGITSLPTIEGNQPTPFAGVQVAHVSAYSQYPKAAALLAQFMADVDGAEVLYNTQGKVPALKDLTKVPGVSEDEYTKAVLEVFNTAFPMPSAPEMSHYWSIAGGTMGFVWNGELTPEEASAKAMEDYENAKAAEGGE